MTLNSCLQEDIVKNGGEEVTAKVSITLPGNGVQSRAEITNKPSDPTKTDMRLYIFVYQNDKIVKTITETGVTFDNTVTENIRLVTGQPYKIAAWADFGGTYYTVDTTDGTVSLPDYNVTGNEAKNDAYYALNDDVVLDANTTIKLTMTRPFGLVQITTEDWQQEAVIDADLQPNAYEITISVPTKLTLLSGEASEEQNVTFAGTITDGGSATQKLSYDYIFAGTSEADLADFTMQYKQDEKEICDYTFTNIPVRRNYITNITGNVLTKNGAVKVTVDQDWTAQIDKELVEVESVTEVATAVSTALNSKDNVTVKVAGEVTTDNDDVALPAVPEGKTVNLIFDNVNTDATLTIKETEGGSSNVSGNVNVTVPQTQESNVNIELPNAHVTVNGKVNTMTASTSATTLVVAKEATIGTLTVKAGNVDIYGTVNTIARAEENNNEVIVTLYDAEEPSVSAADEKIIFKKVTIGQIVNKTTGESYATIGDAVLAAKANNVIEIAEGEYPLNLDVVSKKNGQKYYLPIETEGLTLKAKGSRDNTIIYGLEETANTSINQQNLITVMAKNVTIEGLTIMPKKVINKTIEITADGFTLRNCKFTPNTYVNGMSELRSGSVYFTYPTYGYTEGSINATIENCEFIKGNVCFDHMYAGTFNIKNNVFDNQDEDYPLFTTSVWMPANDFTDKEKDALFNSKMIVNISNNTFKNVQEYTGENYPVIRCAHGMFNLEGNKFPTDGIYWKAMKGSGTTGVAEYVNFGSIFVNYNSILSKNWKEDRTNPLSFAISNDVIEFETMTAPKNDWYSWHGRKTDINMNAKASWTAEATLTIPETTRPVRQSIWYNIKDAAGNQIDWAIVGYKIEAEGEAGYFETWDAHYVNEEGENTGLWSKVNISDLNLNPGDKATVKFSMNGDTMTVFINNIQVYTYKIEGTTASKPAEVILNSYSYGESYKTIWTYPVVK